MRFYIPWVIVIQVVNARTLRYFMEVAIGGMSHPPEDRTVRMAGGGTMRACALKQPRGAPTGPAA